MAQLSIVLENVECGTQLLDQGGVAVPKVPVGGMTCAGRLGREDAVELDEFGLRLVLLGQSDEAAQVSIPGDSAPPKTASDR